MRVVHFATSLDPRHGGVSRVVASLAAAQRALGADAEAVDAVRAVGAGAPPDVLHLHGLWELPLVRAARWAGGGGVPYIVTLHGMLDRWSRAQKMAKKRAAWWLYQRRMLRAAAAIVGFSEEELAEAREWIGAGVRMAAIPNGVEAPPAAPDGRGFRERWGIPSETPLLLFLGRLHPKKGPQLLPEILRGVSAALPDAWLVVAGPADPAAPRLGDELLAACRAAGLGDRVVLAGMLDGAATWDALAAADLFLLPSAEEGMPMAALEALAVGTPAILTPACRLPAVGARGAGRVVERGEFAQAAISLLSDRESRDRVAEAAVSLAREEHAWTTAAQRHLELYRTP